MKIEEQGTHWAMVRTQMMPVWNPNSVHAPFLSFMVIQINRLTVLVLESDDAAVPDYWDSSTTAPGTFTVCITPFVSVCSFKTVCALVMLIFLYALWWTGHPSSVFPCLWENGWIGIWLSLKAAIYSINLFKNADAFRNNISKVTEFSSTC